MSEIMHENYVDRLYAGTLNEDDAKRADELVAENARLQEREKQVMEQVESWERNVVAWHGKTGSPSSIYETCARTLRFILTGNPEKPKG
jgi:hypothetical protein